MKTKFNTLILHPLFIGCLVLLIVNDIFLKWEYHNWWTGKLSDFTGLFIFPIFIATLFPKTKKYAALCTGLVFIFWKSPYSSVFIQLWNDFAPFSIARTVDYSDLIALVVLPFSHSLMERRMHILRSIPSFSLARILVLSISFIAFCATSIPPRLYQALGPPGTVHIGEGYRIKNNEQNIRKQLTQLGFDWRYDSIISEYPERVYYPASDTTDYGDFYIDTVEYKSYYYAIDKLILQGVYVPFSDTIFNLTFRIFEEENNKFCKLHIDNFQLSEDISFSNWEDLKYVQKAYRQSIKRSIIIPLKE